MLEAVALRAAGKQPGVAGASRRVARLSSVQSHLRAWPSATNPIDPAERGVHPHKHWPLRINTRAAPSLSDLIGVLSSSAHPLEAGATRHAKGRRPLERHCFGAASARRNHRAIVPGRRSHRPIDVLCARRRAAPFRGQCIDVDIVAATAGSGMYRRAGSARHGCPAQGAAR